MVPDPRFEAPRGEASRYDAIVIGAGMSGLAAGIRLAQFDRRVLILERHTLWGGLNSFYKHDGRRIDTGLHALTNFARKGARGAPLTKLLRQLRIAWEDLALGEQTYSEIAFPSVRLRFSNGFGLLEDEVAKAFPAQRDGFARLVRAIGEIDPYHAGEPRESGRTFLGRYLTDPLLVDMLLHPILFYGSAREDDIDGYQLVILFRSIFQEGFGRPEGGIKRLLDLLVGRYRKLGGELRMRTGVRAIQIEGGSARGVVLDDGTEIAADRVFSSAGAVETMRLAGREADSGDVGRLSFLESISILDRPLSALGHRATMTFFSSGDRFEYRRPEDLVDVRSGVICASDNYASVAPPAEGILRVTVLANHDRWSALPEEAYRAAKVSCADAALEAASRFAPDPRPHTILHEVATPKTIRRYTGKLGGAVYGSPKKRRGGDSGIERLHLVGTDEGLLGIVGALLSGITVANREVGPLGHI
jgi:phytoene dehydrogenase-like protein